MELHEVISMVANVATAAMLMFTVVTYMQTSKRAKRESTINAYKKLQKTVLSNLNSFTPSEIRRIVENPKSLEYVKVGELLAEIEHFCVGINQGIYDLHTFYKLSHGYFDSDRGMIKPRIEPILESKLKNAKEDYYCNLHDVWRKMEKIEQRQRKRGK